MGRARGQLWRTAAIAVTAGVVLTGCGGDDDEAVSDTSSVAGQHGSGEADAAGELTRGGTLVVGLEAESNAFEPGSAGPSGPSGRTVALTIFDPLVGRDDAGNFQPYLAESLEPNDDLTRWTLRLRPGVVFHDGTPLDAASLKWNFDTLHFAEGRANRGELVRFGLVGMEVVDDLTVEYVLDESNAAFPDLLWSDIGWPVSRVAYEADPEGFGSRPVGTGPFRFESWTHDDRLVVVRNDGYWMDGADGKALPYLDRIEFRPIPDEESRVNSLAAGDVDVVHTLRASSVRRLLDMVEDGGYEGNVSVGNTGSVTVLNTLRPPLDDVRIRLALSYANDQDAAAQVRGGLVPPSMGFFSPDSPWYSADVLPAYIGSGARDVDEARRLVQEYVEDPNRSDGRAPGDPVTVPYQCQPDPALMEAAQLIQQLYGEVGIELELEQLDQATMIQNVVGTADSDPPFSGDYTAACFRAGGEGDPLTVLQSFYGPVASTTGNYTNFTHPDIDAALEQLRTSADPETRYAAVEEITRITGEQAPLVWNVTSPATVAHAAAVGGIFEWTLPGGITGDGTSYAVARFHQAYVGE
ncbi:MAG: hypothetical protein JJE52_06260 [Acidimicrobiia bacterium]|nr:hypothetical protein [Acidimicrobiia bacterium]